MTGRSELAWQALAGERTRIALIGKFGMRRRRKMRSGLGPFISVAPRAQEEAGRSGEEGGVACQSRNEQAFVAPPISPSPSPSS
eukprot:9499623-Pyramimonas_sp.AAC.1